MVESRESVTASLNMSSLYRPLGNLNLSYDKYGDSENGNKQFRWTYNQQLYSGTLGVLSVNVGSNFDSSLSNGYTTNSRSRYAMFNLSVPLASDFSVGFSQDEGGRTLDLSAGQGFSEGPVNYVNGSVSKQLGENSRGATYNAFLDFSTSLATGVMSAMGGQGSNSIGLSASGSMGFGGGAFAFGPMASGSAGMVIDIPQDGDDSLAANINGQHYPLTAGSNYVALSPYEHYEVEVVHGDDALSAYEISAQKEQVTLYPGNVHHFVPGVKQMVTVFGRLVLPSGEPVAHAALNNHIGSAYTADDGSFAIDIDRSKPQISVDSSLTGKFAVKIDLENQRGAVMVDDIIWTGKEVATKVQ